MTHIETYISYDRYIIKANGRALKARNINYLPWYPSIPAVGTVSWVGISKQSSTRCAYDKIDEAWEASFKYLGYCFQLIPFGKSFVTYKGQYLTKDGKWTPLRAYRRIFPSFKAAQAHAPELSTVIPVSMRLSS